MRVAVVSLKGGVGKTTTAVYLAAVAARGRRTVTVVDADPQGSAAVWLEEQPIDGVEVREAPSERLLRKALGQDGHGTVVIVDTPPGSERLTLAAVAGGDVVIVPDPYWGSRGGAPDARLWRWCRRASRPVWSSARRGPSHETSKTPSPDGPSKKCQCGALSPNGSGSRPGQKWNSTQRGSMR